MFARSSPVPLIAAVAAFGAFLVPSSTASAEDSHDEIAVLNTISFSSPDVEENDGKDFPFTQDSKEFAEYSEKEKEFTQNLSDADISPRINYGFTDRTTSDTPAHDNSVGQLVIKGFLRYDLCTASKLTAKFWITAEHCTHGHEDAVGFIKQEDGEFAGIENIYPGPSGHDIALIKVGSGITADSVALAGTNPSNTVRLTITGYGHGRTAATSAYENVVATDASVTYTEKNLSYRDLLKMVPANGTSDHVLSGDSGGPVKYGNTLYGIVSGVITQTSTDKHIADLAASVATDYAWINSTAKNNSGTSLGERWRSFQGGVAAQTYKFPLCLGSSSVC